LFGVLAVEFSAEARNINSFAGDYSDIFLKKIKGGPQILNFFP